MKILLFANTDWYLYNFRLSLAQALRRAGYDVVLLSPPGPYGRRLAELGFEWIPAPLERRSLNPIFEIRFISWLHKLIAKENISLIHAFTIKPAIYGSLVGRLLGIPRINSVAGLGYVFTNKEIKAKILRPLVKALFRIALGGDKCRVILQNHDDVALFDHANLVASGRIHLIPGSGVNCFQFAPPHSPSRGGKFRVVLPARLLWDKGVSEYIAAAKQLQAERRSIEFLLAGTPDPGNPASVPEATLAEWVSSGVVTWLGHVENMPELFHSVDLVVLPSYREGLPKGLIEASACALPIVTTDVPGCRDVVTHLVNGLLVPPRDPVSLARAIAKLQDDQTLRTKLGAAGRDKALAQFDERIIVEETLKVYKELLPPS